MILSAKGREKWWNTYQSAFKGMFGTVFMDSKGKYLKKASIQKFLTGLVYYSINFYKLQKLTLLVLL